MRNNYAAVQPLGYQQLTVSTAVVGLTVPAPATSSSGANYARIRVETNGVRFRDDGVDPSASVGYPKAANDDFEYDGPLNKVKFIRSGAADAVLNILYYRH